MSFNKFLTAAQTQALSPTQSIASLLKHTLSGYRVARPKTTVHASDLTKDTYCPRQVALLRTLPERPLPDEYIPAALACTFDQGRLTERLVRENWLGPAAIGNWKCRRCSEYRHFSSKPTDGTCKHDNLSHDWEYREVPFRSTSTGFEGNPDVLVRLGGQKLFVTELKIIAADEWEKLIAPLAEHRIRTNLYMWLIEDSQSLWRDQINVQEARVLYVSRAHGKKHAQLGTILPFKEFVVKRSDEGLAAIISQAKVTHEHEASGIMPAGVCLNLNDPRVKSCPVKKECFSGQFPVGSVHACTPSV